MDMTLPKNIQGAVFDLDGTLLDSMHVWQDVDRKFFLKRGIPMPPDYAAAIQALDLLGAARYTRERFCLPEPLESLIAEWLEMVGEEYRLRVALKPHAKELLLKLHGRGIRLGIATSSSKELFLPALERLGVRSLFSAFTETGETGKSKRFPDVYLKTAEKLGVAPADCAVFEDILEGILSAKSGGFYAVAVYEPTSEKDEAALKGAADLYLPSFADLG